jgi:hypothetical protein
MTSWLLDEQTLCSTSLISVSLFLSGGLYQGGNQRDLAREKASKKNQKGTVQGETEANKGLTLEERKHRDAERMRIKQQQAMEKKKEDKS